MSVYCVFDVSNILYRTFYANKSEDNTTIAGLAHHAALTTIAMYYRKLKPDKIIMTFDRSSWRKEYTKSEESSTSLVYKGNRRKTMTRKETEKYEAFLTHLNEFEEMITHHTSIIAMAADRLEADDLMAGAVQVLTEDPDNQVIIVSADKDMMQLLGSDQVRLIDPATGKDRKLISDKDAGGINKEDYRNDPDYFMFVKCIRGDKGDNVRSAFPRVYLTRIAKAYTDAYERANLMNEVWSEPDGTQHIVKDVFAENQLLMDLSKQPDDIRSLIVQTVNESIADPGTFSYFHFMKFLGKYEMKKLAQQADTFTDILSA